MKSVMEIVFNIMFLTGVHTFNVITFGTFSYRKWENKWKMRKKFKIQIKVSIKIISWSLVYCSASQWTAIEGKSYRPKSRYGAAGGIHSADGSQFYVSLGFAAERYFDTNTYDIENQGWKPGKVSCKVSSI